MSAPTEQQLYQQSTANEQPDIDIAQFLSQYAPFEHMASDHVQYLADRLKPVFFARGAVIQSPECGVSDRLFIIKQGRVRGESVTAGQDIAWELSVGESFPIGALLARRPVRLLNRAAEDTWCYTLSADEFDALRQQSPEFQDFCTRRMASLLDSALQGFQSHSLQQVSSTNTLNTPVQQLIQREPVSCRATTNVHEVLETLQSLQISSMVVIDDQRQPIGMFTIHDVLSKVTLPELPLDTPIQQVMQPNVISIKTDAMAYEAALLMARHGIGHLCIVDQQGSLIGVISERDLFSLQRIGLVNLSRQITNADSIQVLATLEKDVHRLIEQMIVQGASAIQLAQIITQLNDKLTQRVIELVLSQHKLPDVMFCWLSFGSEGRFEQTLKTDQDNGIVFDVPDGKQSDDIRQQLLPIAEQINHALAECGFPLCPGNVMASNPDCCLSLTEWQQRFSYWLDQGSPENLLKSTIYFDFRPLYGRYDLAEKLRNWFAEKAAPNSRIRQQLAELALQNRPPLGLFGDFKLDHGGTHPHTLDIKVRGITPLVDGARIIALANHITVTNTVERLKAATTLKKLNREDVNAWIEAYQFMQWLRMRLHKEQSENNKPLSNHINPDQLNELEQRILKEAFRQVRKFQNRLAMDYHL